MSDNIIHESHGRTSAALKISLRENVMAEGPLEIRQVYKLLQLVNQKDKVQVEKLVGFGVPGLINLTEPQEGKSALHLACMDNDLEMARFLLSLKAHPDIQDKNGRTATMLAAELGYVDMIKLLARHQASMTLVDKEGKGTLVFSTPTEMHEQIMELALNIDADVNNISSAGKSAFMFACEHAEQCEHLCMRLLEEGANPDVTDPVTGDTPLIAAVKAGSVALVKAILQKGVNPNAVDKSRLNAVHIAATKGLFEAREGCNVTKNLQDLLPSQLAKKNGHKAALKELKNVEQAWKDGTVTFCIEARLHDWSLEHEAELRQAFEAEMEEAEDSAESTVPNETFLAILREHRAPVNEERLENVVIALDQDRWGKVNISDFFKGNLFLPNNYQLSSYKSSTLKTEMKIRPPKAEVQKETTPISPDRRQADAEEEDLINFEPKEISVNLNRCVKSDDFETLMLALSQNVHVDARDRVYKTPLMTACMKGKHQMAEFLLEQKANVNLHDQFKWTALHHACMEGHGDIAQLLIDRGALIDAATANRVTPLMRAIESCKFNCVELLLNAGADVEATNKRGQDCLTLAQKYKAILICLKVEIALENAKLKKAGKKQAPPPKAKKPASTPQTSAQSRRVIALNPDATDHCITLPSATVCGPRVVPSSQFMKRLADRKKRLAKPDLMETTIRKPVVKTKGQAQKPANPEPDHMPPIAETNTSHNDQNGNQDSKNA
ncbi:Ankyrin repeat and EF-hand domain-containing protein 1 [Bagarius yarrelli]|uniref:Ankyrin repeat and EF-hand domain-containing protein 1 n=1 Tax=Bagarius yarrelli TaxID=175774 RepID=A0A556V5J4_BAGYA|nr:Ankyrin repeat and EF-hand domain-containing protein 1 [Bagarius yarrelli]